MNSHDFLLSIVLLKYPRKETSISVTVILGSGEKTEERANAKDNDIKNLSDYCPLG